MSKIAVIRVRGKHNVESSIQDTLYMLNLKHVNNCIIIENTPQNKGMLHKVQHFVTFGEIDESTYLELVEKRGNVKADKLESLKLKDNKAVAKAVSSDKVKAKDVLNLPFKLHPPIKGWERKGIKKTYKIGGALGNRGPAINDLLKRMV